MQIQRSWPATNQLPQHVLQNPAVLVRVNLVRHVDSRDCLERLFASTFSARANGDGHSGCDARGNTFDIERLKSRQGRGRRRILLR